MTRFDRPRGQGYTRRGAMAVTGSAALAAAVPSAYGQQSPIKIGFSAQLTGGLASSGKAMLVAQQIWQEEVNARGGLLGRKVELVYYDDQSNISTVPGIYGKLLDVDKVDILMGAATNLIPGALPMVMQRNRTIFSLLALGSNDKLKYSRYFSNAPFGPDPKVELSQNYFNAALTLDPKPQTVALVGADAEFSKNVLEGARDNAVKAGFKIVYDKTYPPNTVDFVPVVRAVAAANPDLVFVASYPIDSVGMVRAAHEVNLKARMFGGGMVGMQYAGFMQQLGDKLERLVNYHFWVPSQKMNFPGIEDFLKKYQARAGAAGADPLGHYQPPFAYAFMQVIEQAVTATKSLDDDVLAKHIHAKGFPTIVGEMKFNEIGEWQKGRVILIQFQNIDGKAGLEQYHQTGKQVVIGPVEFADGKLQAPFLK